MEQLTTFGVDQDNFLPRNHFLFTLTPGVIEALPQVVALAFHPTGALINDDRLEWVCNNQGYIYELEFRGEGPSQRVYQGQHRIDIEQRHIIDETEKRRRINDKTHLWPEKQEEDIFREARTPSPELEEPPRSAHWSPDTHKGPTLTIRMTDIPEHLKTSPITPQMATVTETMLRRGITKEEDDGLRARARQGMLRACAEDPLQRSASQGSHYEDAGGVIVPCAV